MSFNALALYDAIKLPRNLFLPRDTMLS